MTENKRDFVGFGALNLDLFYLLRPGITVDRIVSGLKPGGEVMGNISDREMVLRSVQQHAISTGRSGGGQAANTTVALARMGFQCGFLGKVGNDEMGDFLLESLENVDKTHIRRGEDSGVCLCILDQDGERANAVFPGCNDTISLDDSDVDYVRNSRALHLTSFCSGKIIKLQKRLLENVDQDLIVTFDPGEIYSRLGWDSIKIILESTTVLFATAEELRLMTGKDPRQAVEQIIRSGVQIVVWKKSGQGSEIISKSENIQIPVAQAQKVLDKTGAGDVYAAGFIAGLLLKLPLGKCGELASEAAALSISAYGRKKYPDRRFLQKFLGHTNQQ